MIAKQTSFHLKSPAFEQGAFIPSVYTCDGKDLSPPLEWEGVPPGTKSFALICDDPDVPSFLKDKVPDLVWDHWIMFNIPAHMTSLSEGLTTCPKEARCGLNSWNRQDYGGPCPPDREHRYFFKLYALNTVLDFPESPTKKELLYAIKDHILDTTELMGRYQRK